MIANSFDIMDDGATFHSKYLFLFDTHMSSSRYSQYFYGNIEFPQNDLDKNIEHNCKLDAFFQLYCSIISNRSNNYMARLPVFDQCLLTTNKKMI